MNSEWWDQVFSQNYTTFAKSTKQLVIAMTLTRVVLGILVPSTGFLQYPQREFLSLLIILTFLLVKLEHGPTPLKKLYLYIFLEFCNLLLKTASLTIFPNEIKLLMLESTVFTMLVQTSIFESLYINALIALKHIVLWEFFYGFETSSNINNPVAIGMSTVIFTMWIMFEDNKRKYLLEKFNAKKVIINSNTQITELLRLFNDGLLITNKDFEMKYTNETLIQILQVDALSLMEKIKSLCLKDSNSKLVDKLKALRSEDNGTSISIGLTNLENRVYEWTAKFISWEGEICYMISAKDVTNAIYIERVSLENKAKNELMRSVSHELRTPINGITLLVDEISKEIPPEYREKLSLITTCAEILNFQISDILDYSELVSGKFELNNSLCDIKKTLIKCVSLFKVQAMHKGLDLRCKIDYLIPDDCCFDESRMQKVVMNLMSNAIKYTSKGMVELCAINTGVGVEVSITDTGIGIQQERLSQIFQMFSNDTNDAMSGLGLYISYNILKLAGSSIKVVSKVNEGSTFSFFLSVFQDQPQLELSTEIDIPIELCVKNPCLNASLVKFAKETPKILLVDDNDFNRLLLGQILKKKGIKFIEAVNGKEAVQLVLQYDKTQCPICCVIMDCNMPVMDGWEATLCINKKYTQGILKKLPYIIGHTAYSSIEDIKKCYASGMISHLLKPTSQEQFLSIINKYL